MTYPMDSIIVKAVNYGLDVLKAPRVFGGSNLIIPIKWSETETRQHPTAYYVAKKLKQRKPKRTDELWQGLDPNDVDSFVEFARGKTFNVSCFNMWFKVTANALGQLDTEAAYRLVNIFFNISGDNIVRHYEEM
jgi:hypothetical protein